MGRRRGRRGPAGFTLAEIMIAATISTFVLAGVLSAFLLIGRTGFAASSYSEMESQTRRALEYFGNDARKAIGITWHTAQSVTLTVVTGTSGTFDVTYAYDATAGSDTHGCFYRQLGGTTSTQPRVVLVRNVAPDFAFQRFKLEQGGGTPGVATTNLETKQLQVTMRAARTGSTVVAANQTAVSARYILRNKRVSN